MEVSILLLFCLLNSAAFQESAHKSDKCVIVVTHSNELTERADVILQLKHGSIQEVKNPAFDSMKTSKCPI